MANNNTPVFDDQGKELTYLEVKSEFPKFWTDIYQKQPNKMKEIWNDEIKSNYLADNVLENQIFYSTRKSFNRPNIKQDNHKQKFMGTC